MRREVNRIRIAAWAMLIAQAGIIFTGGIVRLTGSGLGRTDWPKCTPDSFVATKAMGIHGAIEFGNRTLAVLLALLGVAILVLLWKHRKARPDLFWLNIGLTAIVPVQAVMGGITVWTKLNPWVVAGHFVPRPSPSASPRTSSVARTTPGCAPVRRRRTRFRRSAGSSSSSPRSSSSSACSPRVPGRTQDRRSRPATDSTTSGSRVCTPCPCGRSSP